MTHKELILKHYPKGSQFDLTSWARQHFSAFNNGDGFACLADTVKSAAKYADTYFGRYESRIGQDAVLGPAWKGILQGCLTLLNGELNGLDAGSMDKLIRSMLSLEGIADE